MNGFKAPVARELLRPTEETVVLPWERLRTALTAHGHELDSAWEPRQFAGGYGNLNFLIRMDGDWAVLRRPPFGEIPKGANDMGRENRVLRVLAPVWKLVPAALFFCENPEPFDAPFLISEFRRGLPLHGSKPLGDELSPQRAELLSRIQIDVLAQLHRFEVGKIGAEKLGRPDGFGARTLSGWKNRFEQMGATSKPGMALFEWLEREFVESSRLCVIHNDFKLDNLVLDPTTLEPRAVLDWDMATLGAPFFDLATLLSYWIGPEDPISLHHINHTHSLAKGALDRRELVECYVNATGFASPQDERQLHYFLTLALAKLGVVYMQLFRRYQDKPCDAAGCVGIALL